MKQDDDDFDDNDVMDDDATIELDSISMSHRQTRPKRGWRDIERLREQKEIERLQAEDDWFDELDHA